MLLVVQRIDITRPSISTKQWAYDRIHLCTSTTWPARKMEDSQSCQEHNESTCWKFVDTLPVFSVHHERKRKVFSQTAITTWRKKEKENGICPFRSRDQIIKIKTVKQNRNKRILTQSFLRCPQAGLLLTWNKSTSGGSRFLLPYLSPAACGALYSCVQHPSLKVQALSSNPALPAAPWTCTQLPPSYPLGPWVCTPNQSVLRDPSRSCIWL